MAICCGGVDTITHPANLTDLFLRLALVILIAGEPLDRAIRNRRRNDLET